MSSMSSGVGLSSGLDISSIVDQLLAADRNRRVPLQSRVARLNQTRAAMQQTLSLLLSLRSSTTTLAQSSTTSAVNIMSSVPGVLTAFGATGNVVASPGTTSILVRSLATASRALSAAIPSTTQSLGVMGATIRFDSGRLVDDRRLALLRGGEGVTRGQIRITDRSGKQGTIDLRAALSIADVLRAINEQPGISVEARLSEDGRSIEIADLSGGSGTLKVQEWAGGSTASSLGILSSDLDGDGVITGQTIAVLGAATPLWSLRGGAPIVDGAADLTFVVNGTEVSVDLGAGPGGTPPRAATLGEALGRIQSAIAAAGFGDQLSISIAPSGDRLRVAYAGNGTLSIASTADTSATHSVLAALGLPTGQITGSSIPASPTVVDGERLVFGMDDVGLERLNGGSGLSLNGPLTITDRSGRAFTIFDWSGVDSIQTLLARLESAAAGVPGMKLDIGVDASGSRLRIVDGGGGGGTLKATGAVAQSLGFVSMLSPNGAVSSLQSGDLRRADIGWGTPLAHLTTAPIAGSFRVTAASGASAVIAVASGMTVNDLAIAVAQSGVPVAIRPNALGDALEVVDFSGAAGSVVVTDEAGGTAAALRIAGSSASGVIDGTRTISMTLSGNESAAQIAAMLDAVAGVDAQLNDDGTGANFLMVTASQTGARHGLVLAVDGIDLGLSTLTDARDARVIVAPDVGNGTLITSEGNLLNGVVAGLSFELKAVSDMVVSVTVSASLQPLKTAVSAFAAALQNALGYLRSATSVDVNANTRGGLYGNTAAVRAREALRSLIGQAFGPDGRRLSTIGITIAADGTVAFDEAKLDEALEGDPDGVRALIAGEGGAASLFEQRLASLVDPATGRFASDDDRMARMVDNANSQIDRIEAVIERRRRVLVSRFNFMETVIERLRWQQSTLQSILSGASTTA